MCSTFAAEGEMIAAREKLVRGGAGLTNEDLENARAARRWTMMSRLMRIDRMVLLLSCYQGTSLKCYPHFRSEPLEDLLESRYWPC